MSKTVVAALAGFILSSAAPALAQAPAVAPAAPAAAGPLAVDKTPIEALMANPAAKAIVEKHLPGVSTHPAYDSFKAMTLKAVQPLSGGAVTDAHLAAIQADLDKLPK